MKFMLLNNKEMSKFCANNISFANEYGKEFSSSFPDLIEKINDPEIKSKEDQLFSSTMMTSLNKDGTINPKTYYRLLHDVATAYGFQAIFTLLLFTDQFDFVGSANLGFSLDGVTVVLSDFFIVKKLRRRKYGKLLLQTVIKQLQNYRNIRKILLEVDPENRRAYNMYKNAGFIPLVAFNSVKVRMEYYIS